MILCLLRAVLDVSKDRVAFPLFHMHVLCCTSGPQLWWGTIYKVKQSNKAEILDRNTSKPRQLFATQHTVKSQEHSNLQLHRCENLQSLLSGLLLKVTLFYDVMPCWLVICYISEGLADSSFTVVLRPPLYWLSMITAQPSVSQTSLFAYPSVSEK
jgi:hypothetical protein